MIKKFVQKSSCAFFVPYFSGTKKEPKPKLLSLDIFWWGGGLPREGVGAKKFGMSLETQGIKLFGRDIPGFCRDIPELPEKFEKKKSGFDIWPLILGVNTIDNRVTVSHLSVEVSSQMDAKPSSPRPPPPSAVVDANRCNPDCLVQTPVSGLRPRMSQ